MVPHCRCAFAGVSENWAGSFDAGWPERARGRGAVAAERLMGTYLRSWNCARKYTSAFWTAVDLPGRRAARESCMQMWQFTKRWGVMVKKCVCERVLHTKGATGVN